MLRVSYKVPPEHGFRVGDIKIDGALIEYGGQIAQKMRIKLSAVYGLLNRDEPTALFCAVPELLGFLHVSNGRFEPIMLEPTAGAAGQVFLLCTPRTTLGFTAELLGNKGTLEILEEIPLDTEDVRVFRALLSVVADAPTGRVFFRLTNPDGRSGLVTDPGLEIVAPANPLAARSPTRREMAEELRHLREMPAVRDA